jgi:UDPglucose 6-dehydrogenase
LKFKMKLVVIGTGYVGLVSGACFADIGHKVVCVDKDERKIQILEDGGIPIYEPGLEEVVLRNRKSGNLLFTTILKDALKEADAVLLAVGTPTDDKTGRADLKYVFAATKEVAENIDKAVVVITKSTVPVGTGAKVLEILKNTRPELSCEVASNPEFLREGSAIEDFMHPDRVIIGAESDNTKNLMQTLYSKMIGEGTPVLFTNIPTAELIKYSSNAFLAMKIAFANEVSDICEGVGADVGLVIKGMGMDARIGSKYMQPGPGYGGSCFPKDTMALTHIATDAGYPTRIIEAVIESNDTRKENMARKIIKACGGDVKGKEIAILGLTFKSNTDDMRYSPSLVIIPELIKAGAKIKAYDPVGMYEAKKSLSEGAELKFCHNANEAMQNSDACVILTEWQEFKELDLVGAKELLRKPVIVDLRNLLDGRKAEKLGFKYVSVGR